MVTSTAPLSGDEKEIVVDWENGFGKLAREELIVGIDSTELMPFGERRQTPSYSVPAMKY